MPKPSHPHFNDAPKPELTVRELVAHLLTLPQDALVIHDDGSDMLPVTVDDVDVHTPDTLMRIIVHNGVYMFYNPATWSHEQGQPQFQTVVRFP